MQLVEPRPDRGIPIRITPLIDVVFILLVFFMLTSRLLPVSSLELANDTTGSSSSTGEPLPRLTVTEDGLVRWQEQTRTVTETLTRLQESGIHRVNLATEADTALGDFTRTLSQLSAADIDVRWKRVSGTTP